MSSKQQTGRMAIATLGTEDEIFGVEWRGSLDDLWLLFPGGVIAVLGLAFGGAVHPVLGWVIAGACLAVTGAFIYVTPSHKRPHVHLRDWVNFARVPKMRMLFTHEGDDTPSTAELLGLKHVLPVSDAFIRTDETMVGGVAVHPSNMSLATEEMWEESVGKYEAFLTSVSFRTVSSSGGRPVDPSIVTRGCEARLSDPDVRATPELAKIIRTHREEFPVEFATRGTSVGTYRILVPVSVGEVQLKGHDAVSKLGRVPVVGGLIAAVGGEVAGMSMEMIREEQRQTVAERVQEVRDGVSDIPGCSAERMNADELGNAIEEHWSGVEVSYSTAAFDQSRFDDVGGVAVPEAMGRQHAVADGSGRGEGDSK